MLLYWLLAPLLFVFLISLDYSLPQLRSVYVDRYLLYTLPALLLMTAWGLNVLRGRTPWLLPLALLLVFVPTAVSLSNLYDDDVYARENWRGMFAFLEEARGPDELLLVRSGATLPLFHYISEDVPHQILPSFLVEEAEAMYLEEELPCLLHELAGEWERIWLINATSNKDPHGFPNARNRSSDRFDAEGAYKGWLDARLPVIQEEPFTGLLLTRYELIPARRWPCAAVE
jgi:hypothetical protein